MFNKQDIKARTIHHKARADEASTTLQVMKAKHIEVTVSIYLLVIRHLSLLLTSLSCKNELREKAANYEKQLLLSQEALEEQQIQTRKREKQVQHLQESHQIELDHLKKQIEILTKAVSKINPFILV